MAKYLIQGETLIAIADEVRELSGTTDAMRLADMTTHVSDANAEVTNQTDLVAQIKTALEGKASGGGINNHMTRFIEEIMAPISLCSRLTLNGITEQVEIVEVCTKNTIDVTEWDYTDRYVVIDNEVIMARREWTYESAEAEIDTGRMTAVKTITNDLTSVEEVTVSD